MLQGAGLTANAAALKMRIPNNRLNGILNGGEPRGRRAVLQT